jgi:hypothetical protein
LIFAVVIVVLVVVVGEGLGKTKGQPARRTQGRRRRAVDKQAVGSLQRHKKQPGQAIESPLLSSKRVNVL